MAWRPAKSLEVLSGQLDKDYPGWLFLGFLGDPAHAAVPSDHNPNSAGVVCALDIGAGGGLDIHVLADNLVEKPHPDCKYIISNYRIAGVFSGWAWTPYGGADPHDTHIHVSVGVGPDGKSQPPYDDINLWNVKGEEMTQDQAYAVVSQIYRVATDVDPEPGQADYWAKRIQANPATAAELAAALGGNDYKGDPQFRYKGRHYNEDMEAKYKQGLADGGGTATPLAPGKYIVK